MLVLCWWVSATPHIQCLLRRSKRTWANLRDDSCRVCHPDGLLSGLRPMLWRCKRFSRRCWQLTHKRAVSMGHRFLPFAFPATPPLLLLPPTIPVATMIPRFIASSFVSKGGRRSPRHRALEQCGPPRPQAHCCDGPLPTILSPTRLA